MPAHKIFLDANILVTVLCNEYPRFSACARVLSLTDDKRFEVYTSPLCLAIGAYFSEKKNGKKLARAKIELLASKLEVTTVDHKVVQRTLADKRITDIEDGFQYHSAVASGCKSIITYDKRDFHFSDLDVLDAETFLHRQVLRKV